MSVRLFIFGLGYAGAALARAMAGEATWVGGTVKSVDAAVTLAAEGLRTFIFDGKAAGIGVTEAIRRATHLVATIPPGDGDPALAVYRNAILADDHLAWIGYLSTVGVYGDRGGDWVSEATAPRPTSARSVARLEAERAWQAVADARGVPLAILRLAGIYGPGRNAFVNLDAGTARRVVKPRQVFNRIHVDDLVATIKATLVRRAGGVFNVADDEPAPPQDVVAFAAKTMGVAPPAETALADADLSPTARSFYDENKRVSNARIKSELGVTLAHPTYRDGLAALWRGDWRGGA